MFFIESSIIDSENYCSFRYHLSLCNDNIQVLIRNHKLHANDMIEEDIELSIRELQMWSNSVHDRIVIIDLACEYNCGSFIKELVNKAIIMVENHHDCTYILKENILGMFISLQQIELLFNKANYWAKYSCEFLELAKLEHQSGLMIYGLEEALDKAAELSKTCDDSRCLGEFYARIMKDSDKGCLWYAKAVNLVVDDDDREVILRSIGRYLDNNEFKAEVYEQFFNQVQCKSLRLNIFCRLESKFWDEQKAIEKWTDLCHKIILIEDWQFLSKICDEFYRKGAKSLRKLLKKTSFTEPSEALDFLPYARFLKMLYCDKKKATEWLNKAFQLQIENNTHEYQPFLEIAISAWRELKDISLTHEIIREAADRVENVKEYYQILDTIRKTTRDKLLMKVYYKACISKKYESHEYYLIVNFAVSVLDDIDLANKAVEQAMRHVYDYDAVMLIRQVILDNRLDEKYASKSLVLMHKFIVSCSNAIDLAQILIDLREVKEVEHLVEYAFNLSKSTKDFSLMIRFAKFWLLNTKKAQFFLNRAIEKADTSLDFNLLVQDAKLIYGLDWIKAF